MGRAWLWSEQGLSVKRTYIIMWIHIHRALYIYVFEVAKKGIYMLACHVIIIVLHHAPSIHVILRSYSPASR